LSVVGTESCFFAEAIVGAVTPASAVVVAITGPAGLAAAIARVTTPVIALVATCVVTIRVAIAGFAIVSEVQVTASKGCRKEGEGGNHQSVLHHGSSNVSIWGRHHGPRLSMQRAILAKGSYLLNIQAV
jgi:hypothetical protein